MGNSSLFLYAMCGLIVVLGVSAQLNDIPPANKQDLISQFSSLAYEKIMEMTTNLTNQLASHYDFCITNIQEAENDAFNFSSKLDFITNCILETKGDMVGRLCSVAEIKFYFNNYLANLQNGAGYAKPNKNCNISSWVSGCESGWSSALSQPFQLPSLHVSNEIPARTANSEPCCEGFFCPLGLTCMIPCPLGAYCPKGKLNISTGLCDPYQYRLPPGKDNHTCGAADLWGDVGSTEEVFCSAGFYCPSTIQNLSCSSGHYCRLGSTSENRCYALTSCHPNTVNQDIRAYGIMLIVTIIIMFLLIYNCSGCILLIRERRRAKSREAAAFSARGRTQALERWRLVRESAKRGGKGLQRQFNHTFPCIQSTKPVEEQEMLAHGTLLSDNASRLLWSSVAEGDITQGSSIEIELESTEANNLYDIRHTSVDELDDLQEVPTSALPFSAYNVKKHKAYTHRTGHRGSHSLEYAYGEIEKEKIREKTNLTLTEVIERAGLYGVQTRPKIEVSFKDISLALKGNGKKILRNVTGKLMPGRVTAVMGPSGAGKTTFLNALAGKATGCVVTGSLFINGRPESIHSYKKIIGFVPQDDIIHGNLTVEENLWFSAKCRLPVNMRREDKVLIVERAIEALGLQSVRDSLVGTVEVRGISGGQRKRVNVGLELVMEPSLLFLDEPTSGLDSTSSLLLLKSLRREALAGVNICMVLHQPSYGLFKMFDDLLLLAKGGRTVYFGPVDEIEEYFSSLGIIFPDRVNPPDYFMDILEGIIKPEGSPSFDCNILPVNWMYHKGYEIPRDLQETFAKTGILTSKETINEETKEETFDIERKTQSFGQDLWDEVLYNIELKWDNISHSFLKFKDLSNRQTPNFFKQFRLYLRRVAKQRFRDSRTQSQDYLILLLSGACIGILAKLTDENFGVLGYTYTLIAMPLLCMIAALRTFSLDRLQYWRESAAGMNRLAYFIAKDSVDLFHIVIKPLVYLSMFYYFNNPRSTFAQNYIVTLALVYCVVGIAYIFSVTLNPGSAQLCSVLLPVVSTLVATQPNSNGILMYLIHATYSHWALQAFVVANVKRYSGVWLISRCGVLLKRGYRVDYWIRCISVLVGLGAVARMFAFICLIALNRKRQR